ncbi:hypothetical protein [Flavivirga jejuensis]|uniref:Uncharacterized protein n=1 Tax=Flavivirga jejuensis TaxID=870487 RepID=A0ABT8WK10_9FLAO|nr:hypothetical protein [Flavivirga jejuensis]MDO5973500.1 hypothetical protein [Flavivirga jejuensis]
MKNILINFLIVLLSLKSVFGQVRSIQWNNLPNENENIFPLAYIDGASNIEKKINTYLQDTYLNHEEAYRDSFFEYEGLTPTANICGVSITYEHEFNTAPGIMSFTDLHFFDLRSGEKLVIDKFFTESGKKSFLKIVNERKNNFVSEFKTTISKEQEDYEKLIEIVEYTLNDNISLNNIGEGYDLVLENDRIKIKKNWEYAWGIGRHDLPYIVLDCSYQELEPLLNDYGKKLIITPKKTTENKLFYGYIAGKYKISALIRGLNDPIKITYWYESNKTPINWKGKTEEKKYLLTEIDEDLMPRAKIELAFYDDNKKIRGVGKWYDLVKKKTLTIEFFEH